jgi:hypothetical protein
MLNWNMQIPRDLLLKVLKLRAPGLELIKRLDRLAVVVQRLVGWAV